MAAKQVARPDHVFINQHVWSIEWLTPDEWVDQRHPASADGVCYARKNLIVIGLESGARESHYQETLWHEIGHAIWDTTGCTHYMKDVEADEREEFTIGIQSGPMLFVMQQNPDLMAYLMSDGTLVR